MHNFDTISAALQIVVSAYMTTGQRCSCLRRLILIENKQTKDLIDAIQKILKTIKIADFTEKPDPFCGPLISQKAKDKLIENQNTIVSSGVEVKLDQ